MKKGLFTFLLLAVSVMASAQTISVEDCRTKVTALPGGGIVIHNKSACTTNYQFWSFPLNATLPTVPFSSVDIVPPGGTDTFNITLSCGSLKVRPLDSCNACTCLYDWLTLTRTCNVLPVGITDMHKTIFRKTMDVWFTAWDVINTHYFNLKITQDFGKTFRIVKVLFPKDIVAGKPTHVTVAL